MMMMHDDEDVWVCHKDDTRGKIDDDDDFPKKYLFFRTLLAIFLLFKNQSF